MAKKRTYTNWYKGPAKSSGEKKTGSSRQVYSPVVDGYSVQNEDWSFARVQKRLAENLDRPAVKSEMPEKQNAEVSSMELSERIAKFPETAPLFQILGITPDKAVHEMVDVSVVMKTVRGVNVLKRNGIYNLYELLVLKYVLFLGLRNNGISTAYQILKDVMLYFGISSFPDDPANATDESQKTVNADDAEAAGAAESDESCSDEVSKKDLTVELLVTFNQLNLRGQQTLIDTAKAFLSLEKYTKEADEKTRDRQE